jgi:hypothetical protein
MMRGPVDAVCRMTTEAGLSIAKGAACPVSLCLAVTGLAADLSCASGNAAGRAAIVRCDS